MSAFDLIGDIHGHAAKLEQLLNAMGYRKNGRGWSHLTRTAVFLGDLVDRGPEQVRTVAIVREMVQSGAALAVLGNHELNAIAWHTPDPSTEDEFLRPHNRLPWGPKNRKQHAEFLAEVEDDAELHSEVIEWFLTLPLWLDLPGLRVVHACWHERYMRWLRPLLTEKNCLPRELLAEATVEPEDPTEKDNGEPSVFKAVEALTKGIEIPLPDGFTFVDKDGFPRSRVRVRWWERSARTYRSAALLTPAECAALPDAPIPDHACVEVDDRPVLFGHYWLTGRPAVQGPTSACVDYSAGKGGPLVTYRFDGERELRDDKFMWV